MMIPTVVRKAVASLAALAVGTLLLVSPQSALADVQNVSMGATVIGDCTFTTGGTAATLNLGNLGPAPASQTFNASITCNLGTSWTASVPATLSLTGYSDSSFTSPNGSSIPVSLALSAATGASPSGIASSQAINTTVTAAAGSYTSGFYTGSFVLTITY